MRVVGQRGYEGERREGRAQISGTPLGETPTGSQRDDLDDAGAHSLMIAVLHRAKTASRGSIPVGSPDVNLLSFLPNFLSTLLAHLIPHPPLSSDD